MIQSGELRAGDLVWYEGADGWIPVAVFVEAVEKARSETGDAKADNDTVLREVAEAERSYFDTLPGEPQFAGRTNPDLLSEEERQVIAGARIVQFSYCWSFLLVTFRKKFPPPGFYAERGRFHARFPVFDDQPPVRLVGNPDGADLDDYLVFAEL